jgi:hypothetical protein
MERKLKKLISFILISFLAACGSRVMTSNCFYAISTGISKEELVKLAGKPFCIHRKCDCLEYEYIERFNNGNRVIQENHYYFVIKNDRIISRRVEYVNPPPYSINSYDLQTSSTDQTSEQLD